MAGVDRGAILGRLLGRVEDVLDRDWHAQQGQRRLLVAVEPVEQRCPPPDPLWIECHPRVQRVIPYGVDQRLSQLRAGDLPRQESPADFGPADAPEQTGRHGRTTYRREFTDSTHRIRRDGPNDVLRCDAALPHAAGMATIDQKQRAERRILKLLEDAGLPAPDEVQYGDGCIRLLWHDRKVAVVVELDDFDEIDRFDGYDIEHIAA